MDGRVGKAATECAREEDRVRQDRCLRMAPLDQGGQGHLIITKQSMGLTIPGVMLAVRTGRLTMWLNWK